MSLSIKERYARLDMSKLPDDISVEFKNMSSETADFTDEDLIPVYQENFDMLYDIVETKYPGAIKKGGKIVKEKPATVKSVSRKPKKEKQPEPSRKKLSAADIEFIEDQLRNNEDSTDEEMIAHFVSEIGITEAAAKKWVAKRDAYLSRSIGESVRYSDRTRIKKASRKSGLKGYAKDISEITGITDPVKLEEIEEIMRHEIFHSTLDWQSKAEFRQGALEALEVLNLMKTYPTQARIDKARTQKSNKKLTKQDIIDIEGAIVQGNIDHFPDDSLALSLMVDFGLGENQAKKWVTKREKYGTDLAYGDYHWRTEKKKQSRKDASGEYVTTRDGFEFRRKSPEMKGKEFYDENGKKWKCKGYNKQLDECVLEDSEGKEISACLRDMYKNNPVKLRESGSLVDDCKDTLKEAGYSVRVSQKGNKKVTRKEPRPESQIIADKTSGVFTTIIKDISGSEEKDKEYKGAIDSLGRIEKLISKFFNKLNNLASDNKVTDLEKIEKLFKKLID